MNKTAIKNYAIWARNKLIADISYRAGLMGITADGIRKALPQSTGTTEFYDIGTAEPYSISGDSVKQRKHLVELIQRKEKETNYKTAYKYVLEEVAYTWFNRLIAVRFMEVNDYLPSHIRVLSSDSGKMEPDLVTNPFSAGLSFTSEEEQAIYQLKQESKLDEVFRILFIKQCNALNENLPALFEKTSDYTELLLNLSAIDQDGVVYHLVHDIPEEDFDVERGGQVEIIGWLYQYYNTEPKNEAFAKKGKITKEEVPAVTQLFTPDWIVRYMVENSLGRLWVEGHPNDSLKAGWKYYLEEAEQEPEVQAKLAEIRTDYAKLNPADIKVIDPCMGSGHILVYAFDVLMQIYESAGYGQRDAARSILENNLYGLDIDDRAFQMAYFAVMMKARQYNRRILNGEYKPNVYSIQESNGINRNQLKYFGAGLNDFEKNNAITQMTGLLDTFRDAKEYGSILTVDKYDWDLLDRFVSNVEVIGQLSMYTVGLDDTAEELKQLIAQGKALAQKYHVTTTNPPYMGSSAMGSKLLSFIRKHYSQGKSDLYAAFISRCNSFCLPSCYVAMITQHNWMFLSSYEDLRKELMSQNIVNMAHLGARAFDEIAGEVVQTTVFVKRNKHINEYKGTYSRLLSGDSESAKEELYLSQTQIYYAKEDDFKALPGNAIAYWIGASLLKAFEIGTEFRKYGTPRTGIMTGDNNRFLRVWWEPVLSRICFNASNEEMAIASLCKWFPYNKGGSFKKWYGNNDYVVNWQNEGYEIFKLAESDNRNSQDYPSVYKFKPAISWSQIATDKPAFRVKYNCLSDITGACFYTKDENMLEAVAFCNSIITTEVLNALNPTTHFQAGNIGALPVMFDMAGNSEIKDLAKGCISISRTDWDSFETSWDFRHHPLLKWHNASESDRTVASQYGTAIQSPVDYAYTQWMIECDERFDQLKANEEELNRIFIDIYDLKDELSPEVEDRDITVRKADYQRDIKSLLSYAVGCMFGRYSLDVEGLAYAGGDWDGRKYSSFAPDTDNVIPITDEEYLEDDIVSRLCTWLKVVYGEETLEGNLDSIANALGNKGASSREVIRNYFLNDFFKDHCQTYSVTGSGKRPIYWLFDSGKQNGFKALIYLHRYNADTIGNLRIDYLHRMQRIYESEISRMQDMIDHSTSGREVAQATKRREKLTKQLKECREYDEKLAHLALSRIELDLDDGVKKNYRKIQTANDGKFYEVLADSKNIMSKE